MIAHVRLISGGARKLRSLVVVLILVPVSGCTGAQMEHTRIASVATEAGQKEKECLDAIKDDPANAPLLAKVGRSADTKSLAMLTDPSLLD